MCIIHELDLHYLFQDILEAFEQSKILSTFFLKRVGCLLCTCKNEIFYDSKSIISMQRSLYQWFDTSLLLNKSTNNTSSIERLNYFRAIVDDLKKNGKVDSGTKITFLTLLRDLNNMDFSKLRHLSSQMTNDTKKNKSSSSSSMNKNLFYTKIVKLKFDLKMCSVKEFTDLINKIDNCAIKYIERIYKCRITLRDIKHLSLKHFMGEITATMEAESQNNLVNAEKSLKRLADAVHYRLAKCLTTSSSSSSSSSSPSLDILLQSPTSSIISTPNESLVYSADPCNLTMSSSGGNLSMSAKMMMINDDDDYSLLNKSFNQFSIGDGNETPKTSSPISSTSGSASSLRKFKQSAHNHNNRNNNKKQSKQQKQKTNETSSIINSNSAFDNFVKAALVMPAPTVQKFFPPQPASLSKKEKSALKKQEKMTAALKTLIGIPTTTTTTKQNNNQFNKLNKKFELMNLNVCY